MSGFDQCLDNTQQAGPPVSGLRKGRGGVLGGVRRLPAARSFIFSSDLQDLCCLIARNEDFVLRYGIASQPMAVDERTNP
jgi:hypothetical protein